MLTTKTCLKVIHNKRLEKDIINPLHPNTSMHILHTVLYFYGADEENLFTDQKLLLLVIISFILITLVCDSGVILLGEIRCWSLLGVIGLIYSVDM